MHALKQGYDVSILRPREASRLSLVQGINPVHERAYGEQVDNWLEHFREVLEDVVSTQGSQVNVHEYQAHAKETIVPDRMWRKRMINTDFLVTVNGDDLFFNFLAEEGRRANPMLKALIGYTREHLEIMLNVLGQMPKIPLVDPNNPRQRFEPWIYAVSLDREEELEPTVRKLITL